MYENQVSSPPHLEPTELIEKLCQIIKSLKITEEGFEQKEITVFKNKESVPLKQLYALYAINKIATLANT